MRERLILFNDPMVRAILDGRKTQTRRIVKPQPAYGCRYVISENRAQALHLSDDPVRPCVPVRATSASHRLFCPYGMPGDQLWVREAFALLWPTEAPPARPEDNEIEYRADTDGKCFAGGWPEDERDSPDRPRWRPSIHLPRWASRITLEITDVRVQRLQDISEEDAHAESYPDKMAFALRSLFSEQWNANLWVWALTFKRVDAAARAA